jgi:hypothetical protein
MTVWHAVLGAASAPDAGGEARAELLLPAAQSVAWLRSDLDDLTGAQPAPSPGRTGEQGNAGSAPGRVAAADLVGLLARPASAWGVAYVLRGSRLGGTMIAPQLRAGLRLPPGRATSFLTSQGTDPGREWVAFRRRLDALGLTPVDLQAAGAAARWTFGWVGAVTTRALCTTGPEEGPPGLDRVGSGLSV